MVRRLVVTAVLAVCFTGVATPAMGASSSTAPLVGGSSAFVGFELPNISGAERAAPPSLVAEEGMAASRRAARDREGAAARQRRSRERRRYANKDARGAAASLRQVFGAAAVAPTWTPPAGDIESYISDHVARLRPAGAPADARALVDSSVPLVDEQEQPVDLALVADGAGFTPEHPLVDVAIPGRTTGEVRLDAGTPIDVSLSGVDAQAQQVGERVMYANAAPDADWLVGVEPYGARFEAVLRSPSAPEELTLGFDVDGSSPVLLLDGQGGALVQDGHEPVATVSAPVAWDAENRPVPVRYENANGRLGIVVEHRGGDYAYPIMVDPVVDAFHPVVDGFSNTTPVAERGWRAQRSFSGFDMPSDSVLYLLSGSGRAPLYPHNEWAWWYYNAPGFTSEVYAFAAAVTHGPGATSPATCLSAGLNTGEPGGWKWPQGLQQHWVASIPSGTSISARSGSFLRCDAMTRALVSVCQNASCTPTDSGTTSGGTKVAGIQQLVSGGIYPALSATFIDSATVYLSDPDKPVITGGPPATATDPAHTWSFQPSDPGLGVWRYRITSVSDSVWPTIEKRYPCAGTAKQPCPVWPTAVTSEFGELSPGAQELLVEVWDPVGHRQEQRYNVNVTYHWASWRYGGADHVLNTGWEILVAKNALAIAGAQYARLWKGFTAADQATLSGGGTGGSTATAPTITGPTATTVSSGTTMTFIASDPSGIGSLRVFAPLLDTWNGRKISPICSASCPTSVTLPTQALNLFSGSNVIRAVAVNGNGVPTTRDFTMTMAHDVPADEPDPERAGDLTDPVDPSLPSMTCIEEPCTPVTDDDGIGADEEPLALRLAGTSASPIQLVGVEHADDGGLTVDVPEGAREGDLLLAEVSGGSGAPAGWTVGAAAEYHATGHDLELRTYWRLASDEEPASYTFTGAVGGIKAYRGVDVDDPIVDQVAPDPDDGDGVAVLDGDDYATSTFHFEQDGGPSGLPEIDWEADGAYSATHVYSGGEGTSIDVPAGGTRRSGPTYGTILTILRPAEAFIEGPLPGPPTFELPSDEDDSGPGGPADPDPITVVGVEHADGGLAIAVPTGVQVGDLLLAEVSEGAVPPTGWTIGASVAYDRGGRDPHHLEMQTYWRIAGASEPSSYSFGGTLGGIKVLRGVDAAEPIVTQVAPAPDAGAGSVTLADDHYAVSSFAGREEPWPAVSGLDWDLGTFSSASHVYSGGKGTTLVAPAGGVDEGDEVAYSTILTVVRPPRSLPSGPADGGPAAADDPADPAPVVGEPIALVGVAHANGGSPLAIAVPAGVVPGDLLLAEFETDEAPAGWTEGAVISHHEDSHHGGRQLDMRTFWRFATEDEPTNYTFDATVGGLKAYRNVDANDPVVKQYAPDPDDGDLAITLDGDDYATSRFFHAATDVPTGDPNLDWENGGTSSTSAVYKGRPAGAIGLLAGIDADDLFATILTVLRPAPAQAAQARTGSAGSAAPKKIAKLYGIADDLIYEKQIVGDTFSAGRLRLLQHMAPGTDVAGKDWGISEARTMVPFDAALYGTVPAQINTSADWVLGKADQWIERVTGAPGNLRPLISFEHIYNDYWTDHTGSAVPPSTRKQYNPLPSDAQYIAGITAFLERYKRQMLGGPNPRTHGRSPCDWNYTAWNEPNNGRQPTKFWKTAPTTVDPLPTGWIDFDRDAAGSVKPFTIIRTKNNDRRPVQHFGAAMAGRYFGDLQRTLDGWCKNTANNPSGTFTGQVLAGDFESRSSWSWNAEWNWDYWRFISKVGGDWAYHAYSDIKRDGKLNHVNSFVSQLPSKSHVWLTEQSAKANGNPKDPSKPGETTWDEGTRPLVRRPGKAPTGVASGYEGAKKLRYQYVVFLDNLVRSNWWKARGRAFLHYQWKSGGAFNGGVFVGDYRVDTKHGPVMDEAHFDQVVYDAFMGFTRGMGQDRAVQRARP